MALHLTKTEHDADPPSGWTVSKHGERRWKLCGKDGAIIDTYDTKKAAELDRARGFYFNLYQREAREFATQGEAQPCRS